MDNLLSLFAMFRKTQKRQSVADLHDTTLSTEQYMTLFNMGGWEHQFINENARRKRENESGWRTTKTNWR